MDVHFILFSEKFRYCCIKEGDRLWVHTRITPPVNNGNLTNLIMYVILLVKLVPAQRISLPDIGG